MAQIVVYGHAEALRPRIEAVSDAVRRAFADAGFTAPTIFTVTPSAGAHRDA